MRPSWASPVATLLAILGLPAALVGDAGRPGSSLLETAGRCSVSLMAGDVTTRLPWALLSAAAVFASLFTAFCDGLLLKARRTANRCHIFVCALALLCVLTTESSEVIDSTPVLPAKVNCEPLASPLTLSGKPLSCESALLLPGKIDTPAPPSLPVTGGGCNCGAGSSSSLGLAALDGCLIPDATSASMDSCLRVMS